MIHTEIIELDGIQYRQTYSDLAVMIERDGELYSEAIDPIDEVRAYTETDEPIPIVEEIPLLDPFGSI